MTQVLVVLDTSVMNVALPSARADLGLSEVGTSWVALAYTVGFAGTLLAGARLADAFGCERVLAWSVIVFTLASGGGGLAPDGEVLIAARAVQGVCAAVASPATFTLLTVAFPEGPSRIRAVAIWTGASLAGGGAGNVLSGLLTEYVSWRAVLLINLPIGIAIAVGAFALDRKRDTAPRGHVDLPGTVLVTGVFTAAAVAVSSLEPGGYLMIGTAAGSVALVLLLVLLGQQRRARVPLVPWRLWRNRAVVAGNGATLLAGACFQVAIWYFLSFTLQRDHSYSAAVTGIAFLPLTVTMLAVSTWAAPRLLRRFSVRAVAASGALVAAAGFAAQAAVLGTGDLGTLLAPSLLIGIGGGLLNTPLATAVTGGVERADAGAASGLMNTSKQFGGSIGLAALAALPADPGSHTAFIAMSLLITAAGAASLIIPSQTRGPASRETRGGFTMEPDADY
ncbi:MFS transporter [Microbacterium resistens]|uniref:MFS transporter n=1 Tax=Microbacterium resistens TaxID=156977 RepID=UPI001C5A04CD|nr:MFS transporter [Microbacterium resistens]